MTRADNATVALGRSRDTLVGAAPLPPTAPTIRARAVILRLWGFTRADLADAERDAQQAPGAERWDVSEIVPSSGGQCPIPLRDRLALAQGAYYDYAWAAYPVWSADE